MAYLFWNEDWKKGDYRAGNQNSQYEKRRCIIFIELVKWSNGFYWYKTKANVWVTLYIHALTVLHTQCPSTILHIQCPSTILHIQCPSSILHNIQLKGGEKVAGMQTNKNFLLSNKITLSMNIIYTSKG